MRFDDPAYVTEWRAARLFPKIHHPITQTILSLTSGGVLDLGASTGLLSRALTDAGRPTVAVEPSARALSIGAPVYAGPPPIPVLHTGLTRQALPTIGATVRAHHLTVLAARRVIPETADMAGLDAIADLMAGLANAGIRVIVLEGRQDSVVARHPLKNADLEVAAIRMGLPHWDVWDGGGNIRVVHHPDTPLNAKVA